MTVGVWPGHPPRGHGVVVGVAVLVAVAVDVAVAVVVGDAAEHPPRGQGVGVAVLVAVAVMTCSGHPRREQGDAVAVDVAVGGADAHAPSACTAPITSIRRLVTGWPVFRVSVICGPELVIAASS